MLCVHADISELELSDTSSIEFPNGPDDLMVFDVTLRPDEGFWQGAAFTFHFEIPEGYPHDVPSVICTTPIYHPNINTEGKICLNILREDWRPVLNINAIVFGLSYILLDPNPDDPLNIEAAEVMRNNPAQFKTNVDRSLAGGVVDGVRYQPNQA